MIDEHLLDISRQYSETGCKEAHGAAPKTPYGLLSTI